MNALSASSEAWSQAVTPTSLPAFRRYRPVPGHPDWKALDEEARLLAAALRPGLERPRTGLAEARRRLASYRTAAENYAINWRRARDGREDLLPLYFIWTTTRACNFRCTYCDDHRGRRYPELSNRGVLSTAQGRRLLEVMRTRTPSVYFAGGEPTARKDLPELTRHARDLGYYPIVTNTNGSLFHKTLRRPEWRTWLADVDVIVVSLDALDLRRLSEMWVTRRPDEVVRNLLLLRHLAGEMRFKLMVNTVIQPDTVEEAGHVLDLATDLGLWFCPVPVNVGPRVSRALTTDPSYAALVERILAHRRAGGRVVGSSRMNRRLLRSERLSCRNTLKPHVDYDGRLAWPCKAAVNVEPEFVDVLQFEHVDALWSEATRRVDPTRFHGPAVNQCGADCNWAQNYTTDAYAHGLKRPWTLAREIAEFLSVG